MSTNCPSQKCIVNIKMKKVTYLICVLIFSDSVSAQLQNCKFRITKELVCNRVRDCSTLRRYRDGIASSLIIVRSCNEALRKADLYKFPKITEFVLDDTMVEGNALEYLVKIVRLDLKNNSITDLPENIFASNKGLTSLSFTFNDVSALPVRVFSNLRGLRKLHLQNNCINRLDPGVFQHNTGLRLLNVSHNSIQKLRRGVFYFENVPNSQLLLSYNSINEIESGTFENCSRLTTLCLDHNDITSLEANDLRGLSSLRVLDVSYNMLQTLEPTTFASATQLKTLRVEYNRIALFGPNMVAWARISVASVSLQGNPLSCVCGGRLAEAYEQSAALGPVLDLVCDDGRSWNVLAPSACHQSGENDPQTQFPTSTAANVRTTVEHAILGDYSVVDVRHDLNDTHVNTTPDFLSSASSSELNGSSHSAKNFAIVCVVGVALAVALTLGLKYIRSPKNKNSIINSQEAIHLVM